MPKSMEATNVRNSHVEITVTINDIRRTRSVEPDLSLRAALYQLAGVMG
jgi:hypothetical protein